GRRRAGSRSPSPGRSRSGARPPPGSAASGRSAGSRACARPRAPARPAARPRGSPRSPPSRCRTGPRCRRPGPAPGRPPPPSAIGRCSPSRRTGRGRVLLAWSSFSRCDVDFRTRRTLAPSGGEVKAGRRGGGRRVPGGREDHRTVPTRGRRLRLTPPRRSGHSSAMKHVARNGAESAFGSGRRTAGRPIGGRENGRRGDRRARRRTPRRRAPLVPRAVARLAPAAVALVALSCSSPARNASLCDEPRRTGTLPADVAESSGLAASRSHPGVFWTHNDSGDEAFVFAIDSAGRLLGRVRVTGAENHDWEDIALAPCGDDAGDCLYIADTGNNLGSREEVAIYRVPEPAPDDSATAPAV